MRELQIPELILNRRSIYPPQMDATKSIEKEAILKLLESANYAPTHKRTEPWRFVVFAGEQVDAFYNQLYLIYKGKTDDAKSVEMKKKKWETKAKSVSHVIAICMNRDPKESVPSWEEEWAVACSVQNILLTAEPLGICGYWGTGDLAFSEEMKEFLKLSEKDRCMGFLQLGILKEGLNLPPKKPLSSIEEKIEWR